MFVIVPMEHPARSFGMCNFGQSTILQSDHVDLSKGEEPSSAGSRSVRMITNSRYGLCLAVGKLTRDRHTKNECSLYYAKP